MLLPSREVLLVLALCALPCSLWAQAEGSGATGEAADCAPLPEPDARVAAAMARPGADSEAPGALLVLSGPALGRAATA